MTYQTAAATPLRNVGASSDRVYRRAGFSPSVAATFRRLGIPASVAARLRSPDLTCVPVHDSWLAQTFSRRGLRALCDPQRGFSRRDLALLRALADRDLPRLRGYVSQTRLSVTDIGWLMDAGVPSQQTVTWTRRLAWPHQATNLASVLKTATVLHGVPAGHLAGWVRFANRHQVPYPGETAPWRFLGGDTALMVRAGLTPREAHRLVARGEFDAARVGVLAGLRGRP